MSTVPDFYVELTDPNGVLPKRALTVKLNKVPKQGSWFDLGDGTPAKVVRLMIESGEKVIYAALDTEVGRQRLKPTHRRR